MLIDSNVDYNACRLQCMFITMHVDCLSFRSIHKLVCFSQSASSRLLIWKYKETHTCLGNFMVCIGGFTCRYYGKSLFLYWGSKIRVGGVKDAILSVHYGLSKFPPKSIPLSSWMVVNVSIYERTCQFLIGNR